LCLVVKCLGVNGKRQGVTDTQAHH